MLIVGLGNPGARYQHTRHNIGFLVVDHLASCLDISWKTHPKLNCQLAITKYLNKQIILAKPHTFMNLSGTAVQSIKNYYSIEINDIIVCHDELEQKLGYIKYKCGGGSAGHNGLRSITQYISGDYHRLRFGINRPIGFITVADYVLSDLTDDEYIIIKRSLEYLTNNTASLFNKDFSKLEYTFSA